MDSKLRTAVSQTVVAVLILAGLAGCVSALYGGQTSEFRDAMAGDMSAAQRYMAANDVDATDFSGQTLLHQVARNGHPDIAAALIDAGASVDFRVTRENSVGAHYRPELGGATPLYVAAANGHQDVVELLMQRGADINIETMERVTPLRIAVQNEHAGIVRLLANRGADVSVTDENGTDLLMFAAMNADDELAAELLSRGADASATNAAGNTALLLAGRQGSAELVRTLIAAGADVNAIASGGASPLFEAAYYGNLPAVEALVAAGADVHHATDKGKSAAHIAAFADNYDVARLLVHASTQPAVLDEFVEDVYATALTHDLAAELLAERGEESAARSYADIAVEHYRLAGRQYAGIAGQLEAEEQKAQVRRAIVLGVVDALQSYGSYLQQRQIAQIGALSQAANAGTGLSGYYRALPAQYDSAQIRYLSGAPTQSLYWHARSAGRAEKAELFRLKAELCEQSADELSE